MMRTALLAILLALTPLLAGCAGDDPPAKADESSALDLSDVEVETTETLGGIRGVVVDPAIRPIEGAHVRLVEREANATTDANGVFTFDALDPAVYLLEVQAAGYLATQTSVEVAAGEVASVKLALEIDASPTPFYETHQHDGFIQLGASVATFAVSAALETFGQDGVCNCYMTFTTTETAQFFVIEATWESTTPCDGMGDDMYYQIYEGDTEDIHISSAFLEAPIYVVLNKTELWPTTDVFETSLTEGALCPRYNQEYRYFVTVWNQGAPPEGWSIVAGTA